MPTLIVCLLEHHWEILPIACTCFRPRERHQLNLDHGSGVCGSVVIVVIHDKTLLCLAELIHTDKMKLGIHLGFKHDDVKRISGDHPTDAVSAVMEILTVWRAQ